MAVNGAQVTVGTTATMLTKGGDGHRPRTVVVTNPAAGVTVSLGPAGVGAATGYLLVGGASTPPIPLGAGDDLYGRVAAGSQAVSVLVTNS